ncbi:hypothetical protein ACQR1I_10830 [Bradyrhizobium sp. HKCCYLS2038]|uniref:hypothetical protein n=1 Tax=unclassified Bradyrhizobium TaxID=2631580 RepID=UPI003EBBF46D
MANLHFMCAPGGLTCDRDAQQMMLNMIHSKVVSREHAPKGEICKTGISRSRDFFHELDHAIDQISVSCGTVGSRQCVQAAVVRWTSADNDVFTPVDISHRRVK